jgi:RNA polymerase sigma-70 factor, ECF subfamily
MDQREIARLDPRPDSDATRHLLDLAAAGDGAAVNDLMAECREGLRGLVELHLDRTLRARVDPSDVVQEAQAELVRRLPDFLAARPMPFHLWSRKLAYQRVLNARRDNRAARRDVGREVGPDPTSLVLAAALLDSGPSPSEAALAAELAGRVAAVIDALPNGDREILLLRQAEHMPFDEIAVLLDVQPAAARQRFGRSLIRLQKALREAGIAEDRQ